MLIPKAYVKNFSIAGIFILIIATACAQDKQEGGRSYTQPSDENKDIQIVVKIGDKSSTITFSEPDKRSGRRTPIVRDQNGNLVKECALCSEELERKFGPGCRRAKEKGINICENLVDTTVGRAHNITILESRRCGTIIVDGHVVPSC